MHKKGCGKPGYFSSKKPWKRCEKSPFSAVFWYNGDMERKTFDEQELNKLPKEMLIRLYLQMAAQLETLTEQNRLLIKQMADLQESVAVLTQQRFGRKTEKTREMVDGQLSFADLGNGELVLNEAEVCLDAAEVSGEDPEDALEESLRRERRKRRPGKQKELLGKLELRVEEHTLEEDELEARFPGGYRRLPDDITTTLEYVPARFVATEHHIGVYTDPAGKEFVRAEGPKKLLNHSVLSPSLAAAILNGKYTNALPLHRLEGEFRRSGVELTRQTMSRWVVSLSERYFEPLCGVMAERLREAELVHADETPFVVKEDRKEKGSKTADSYMWVYHTADRCGSPPIFIYDYQRDRKGIHAEEFLGDFRGILMTDGYEPYHTLAKGSGGRIRVAGCWAHCKRKFAEVVKASPSSAKGSVAWEANNRIAAIYHVDNMTKGERPEERQVHRETVVKPLVDAFFAWAAETVDKVGTKKTQEALRYALKQEPYLREFLRDGRIPLDNSDAERSIRSFCVGKHNWHVIETKRGAKASGILYSITETAKANGLKVYDYLKYVLEDMLEHEGEITKEYLKTIVPWSASLPESLKVNTNKK